MHTSSLDLCSSSFFPPIQMGTSIPAQPKYELGQLIRIEEIERILYTMRFEEYKRELSYANAERPSDARDEKILQLETQVLEIMKILNKYNIISSSRTKESLINKSRSPITFDHQAYSSERSETITFSRSDITEGKTVASLVKSVARIFVQNGFSSFVPEVQIAEMTRQINNALESEKKVTIIGSYLPLTRCKIMHPVLSDEAISDETLLTEAHRYYVLTQEELAGLFLGFEAQTIPQEPTDTNESTEFSISSPPQIWFKSEGVLPKIGPSLQSSLWKIYNSWKERIQADPESGRPARYQCEPLSRVLEYNRGSK